MGKIVYMPKGAASEYSKYAANFYIGCMGKNSCKYCYCPGILRGYWPDVPTLKKSLVNEATALMIFDKEVLNNHVELMKHGLFFNFVSDPCLPETYKVNMIAVSICLSYLVPVKLLTKQVAWVDDFININHSAWKKDLISIGFTLTGHDELEPGAATNMERIDAAFRLHNAGFKTFGSFEPIVDLDRTYKMILITLRHDCIDLYKIGLQSGKKYDKSKLLTFVSNCLLMLADKKIYFKDSLLKQSGITRESLPSNCVNRDFNL